MQKFEPLAALLVTVPPIQHLLIKIIHHTKHNGSGVPVNHSSRFTTMVVNKFCFEAAFHQVKRWPSRCVGSSPGEYSMDSSAGQSTGGEPFGLGDVRQLALNGL